MIPTLKECYCPASELLGMPIFLDSHRKRKSRKPSALFYDLHNNGNSSKKKKQEKRPLLQDSCVDHANRVVRNCYMKNDRMHAIPLKPSIIDPSFGDDSKEVVMVELRVPSDTRCWIDDEQVHLVDIEMADGKKGVIERSRLRSHIQTRLSIGSQVKSLQRAVYKLFAPPSFKGELQVTLVPVADLSRYIITDDVL